MQTTERTARAVCGYWDKVPETVRAEKMAAIRRHVLKISAKDWAKPGAMSDNPAPKLLNECLDDLHTVWDLAAGVFEGAPLERSIWLPNLADTLNKPEPEALEILRINQEMNHARPHLFGAIIFEACQTLPAEALDFAYDWAVWSQPPIAETRQTDARMLGAVFGGPNIWEKIERSAPADKKQPTARQLFEQMQHAEQMLERLESGQLPTEGRRQRNQAGADLIRAARYFWRLVEPVSAGDLWRAYHGNQTAADDRAAQLIAAARETFSAHPKTRRTFENYLKG